MSYVSPFNCDNAWFSFEDILRKVYTPDGYIRTYGSLGAGYCPEFQAVLDYWESIGATPPSDAVALAYNTWLCGMVDVGYYAKAEFLDFLSTHSQDTALTNWRNPGTFNPSEVNAPTWTQYQGYTGNQAGGKCINLNFNPVVNGTTIGQNNICAIIGIGNNVAETYTDFGGRNAGTGWFSITARYVNDTTYWSCNDGSGVGTANTNSKKYYTMSRGVAANYDTYINLVKSNKVVASTAAVNNNLYACGYNNAGTIVASNKQIRFSFLFSYLTELEVNGVINLTETLLDTLGTGLI